ncbi:putative 60S ribosomal protein L6 [Venustampulla echinocandica]|uniref:Large ribosomal subunit protein uL6m n=1 Tax=Venustampulla echinocandica TaxID=2656787 RepID=A0A370TNR5_9HELO|nr:putative 60S ribosomal protein L6 [Venustampulla echinocandica]RDL37172.1 putative 60S ribosomal protein L6 [Venustampulla echinocandica]
MLSTARSKGLERAIASAPSASIPSFLLPAFPLVPARSFSSSSPRASQIGRAPISIPPEVSLTVLPPRIRKNGWAPLGNRPTIKIEGPLGQMSMTIPPFVLLEHDIAARKAYVTVEDKEVKKQREMWGTTRAYLQNHILGVSEGHTAILRLVGVGYRATVEDSATTVTPEFEGQKFVVLKVGYSHPIELPVPKGMKASVPQPTRILLEGPEKEVILQFAANIRKWRVPEPYKGKGIFVNGETIKLKAKKIK